MVAALARHPATLTANDRLKESFTPWLWASVALAAALHFLVLAYGGAISLPDLRPEVEAPMHAVPVPPAKLPPPPEVIVRPAYPTIGPIDSEGISFPEPRSVWGTPPEAIQPPVTGAAPTRPGDWIPREVEPVLRNGPAVQKLLLKSYPSQFQQAGIGGRTVFHILVGTGGEVVRAVVAESSGHAALDRAAESVAQQMKFSPALNRSEPVAVWVQIPIVFQTR